MAETLTKEIPGALISIVETYLSQLQYHSENQEGHLTFCASSACMSPEDFKKVVLEYKVKYPDSYQLALSGRLPA